MGRQSHLIRLALGRSAFEEPLRDEDGQFFVDPHAFDTDARGYRQQFDDRGHPINEATTRAERKLQRAQNEVLEVVGVVRTKYGDENLRTRHHGLSQTKLVDLVNYENAVGIFLRVLNPLAMDLSTWWITSFRTRLVPETFRSYLEPGLMHALRSEGRLLGAPSLLFSGMFYAMTADELRDQRCWLTPSLHRRDQHAEITELTWGDWGVQRLKDFGLFTIEWPIRTYGTIQGLGLIPFGRNLSWASLLTLQSTSAIYFPTRRMPLSLTGYASMAVAIASSPFVAAYLLEQLRESVEAGLYFLLQNVLPRPSCPDQLSIDGRVEELDSLSIIPRFGYVSFSQAYVNSSLSFYDQLKLAFPACFRALRWLKLRMSIETDPSDRNDILQASKIRYGLLIRENQRRPFHDRRPDEELRRMAIAQAFSEAQIDPRGSHPNIHQWADDISAADDASTATPDPQDLFLHNDIGPDEGATRNLSPSANGYQSVQSTFSPAVPLETLLEPTDLSEAARSSPSSSESPPTPVLGISRATSLTQPFTQQGTTPRPVRRPTDLDENISAIASSLRSAAPPPDRPRAPKQDHLNSASKTYRVTSLSTFPADSIAYYTGSFLTSIVMLPFDVYYTRLLAKAFLESSTIQHAGLQSIARDIGPSRPTSGTFGMTTVWLGQKVLLTFGLEALARILVSTAGTKICLWIGQKWFLWSVA